MYYLTIQCSNLARCSNHIKLKKKKAKLIHHPPLPASPSLSLNLSLCCCSVLQSLCTVSTAVRKSTINTHQMHGGTGQISAAELCVPAAVTRRFAACQEKKKAFMHWERFTRSLS